MVRDKNPFSTSSIEFLGLLQIRRRERGWRCRGSLTANARIPVRASLSSLVLAVRAPDDRRRGARSKPVQARPTSLLEPDTGTARPIAPPGPNDEPRSRMLAPSEDRSEWECCIWKSSLDSQPGSVDGARGHRCC